MAHDADYPYIFRQNMGIYLTALNEVIAYNYGERC